MPIPPDNHDLPMDQTDFPHAPHTTPAINKRTNPSPKSGHPQKIKKSKNIGRSTRFGISDLKDLRPRQERQRPKEDWQTLMSMADGITAIPAGRGKYKLGSRLVSWAQIDRLARDELITDKPGRAILQNRYDLSDSSPTYQISSIGMAACRRQRALEPKNRTYFSAPKQLSRKKSRDWQEQTARQDSFRHQHQNRETVLRSAREGKATVTYNRTETPLGWLRARKDKYGCKLLSENQFEAGERLRVDFELGGLGPRTTMNYDSAAIPGRQKEAYRELSPSERQIYARERFHKAIQEAGPELSDVLIRVCCFLQRIERVERDLDWPKRSAKLVLTLGLDRLARHYGLTR